MKIGSIVVCIDNSKFKNVVQLETPYEVEEIIEPGKEEIYGTVHVIYNEYLIRLVGVHDYIFHFGMKIDVPFPIRYFREIQLPGCVEEILKQTEPALI